MIREHPAVDVGQGRAFERRAFDYPLEEALDTDVERVR